MDPLILLGFKKIEQDENQTTYVSECGNATHELIIYKNYICSNLLVNNKVIETRSLNKETIKALAEIIRK